MSEALRLAEELLASHGPTEIDERAAAELRRLDALVKEWERKAATWLASPEAANRLDGYRELTNRLEMSEAIIAADQALIAGLRADKAQLLDMLEQLMFWDNGKPEYDEARTLIREMGGEVADSEFKEDE